MRSSRVFVAIVIGGMLAQSAFAAPPAPQAPLPGEMIAPGAVAGPCEIPVDLKTALQWTLSSNPDLVALRQDLCVSAAAVAVARRFPMSLNPTVSLDERPWTFEGDTGQGHRRLETDVAVSWMQPLELGHRRDQRLAIAHADYSQTQWNILQAELLALVETYRLHQDATYRSERLRVAQHLAEFNARFVQIVRHQTEAGQLDASELVLAEVENRAMQQVLETARQQYVEAVAAMRRQIGIPDYAASAVPVGPLKVPEGPPSDEAGDEARLARIAVESNPEIRAAEARAVSSRAAVCLARAERIPIPSIGPVYEHDESGTTFYGLVLSTPVPVLNTGKTAVVEREMEYRRDLARLEQLRRRTTARTKAAIAKWNETKALIGRVDAASEAIQDQAEKMDRLFMAGQADSVKLFQVRQRLIEAENARLDMVWQAIQAYADLLEATGGAPLLGSLSDVQEGVGRWNGGVTNRWNNGMME